MYKRQEEVASFRAKDENANPLFRVARTISDAVRKKYFYQVMTPIAVIDSLEGYSNGPLTRIYHDMEKAADKARVDYLRYVKMQEEFFEKNKGYGKRTYSGKKEASKGEWCHEGIGKAVYRERVYNLYHARERYRCQGTIRADSVGFHFAETVGQLLLADPCQVAAQFVETPRTGTQIPDNE